MAERMPERQSPTFSYQSSTRHSNPDVFSDEFALDPIQVSDGFGPSITHLDASAPVPTTPTRQPVRMVSRRSVALQPPSEQSPNPVKKIQAAQGFSRGGSLSSRNDPQMSQIPYRTPSLASMSAMSDGTFQQQRPISIISGYSMPRTQSVYRGATGPSHPYGMYPQDTSLNRSSTTSSIQPPDRSYSGNNGPTHPYSMYPQSVVPEGEVISGSALTPTALVGFPGLGQPYTRRLGPDGEEADDIIGADGHTEQLPPYTRFPDALTTKERYAPGTLDGQSASPQTPLQPVPTSASSDENDGSEDERAQINTAAAAAAGLVPPGSNTRKRWRRKRACCGNVPRWALITIAILSILLATLLGAIVGKLIAHRNASHPSPSSPTTAPEPEVNPATTSTTALPPDATLVTSTPTNLPTLPQGNFEVPLATPIASSTACLPDGQTQAWQCVNDTVIGMIVNPVSNGAPVVSLSSPSLPTPYFYGAQDPILSSTLSLILVMDTDDPTNGPAYFFRQTYDKIVVLQPGAFTAPSKRSDKDDWHRNSEPAIPGSKPWFCFWNGTVVEGFIYVTQNNTNATIPDPRMSSAIAAATAVQSQIQPQASIPTGPPQGFWTGLPEYPKVVKIEERRALQNAVAPYCEKMQILDNGGLGPVPDADGNSQTIILLNETETSSDLRDIGRRSEVFVSPCSCEWTNNT